MTDAAITAMPSMAITIDAVRAPVPTTVTRSKNSSVQLARLAGLVDGVDLVERVDVVCRTGPVRHERIIA